MYQMINKNNKCDDCQDRIYYNIAIPGTNAALSNIVPAIYQEQLNQSIVNNPRDYYMAIVRFSIPTISIPILIFTPQPYPNVTQPNLGIYSVTLEYNGNFSPETFVQYVTTDPDSDPPIPPTAQNIYWTRNLYYYMYNYVDFLTMINAALVQAFFTIPGFPPLGSTAPFFIFTPETQLISLVADQDFYDLSLATPIKIYVNYSLQRFLDGIPAIFYLKAILGRDTQFLVQDTRNNTYLLPNKPARPPPMSAYYLIMTQNYNTLSDWNSFKSLQVVTNLVPIKNEYVPSAQIQQNNAGTLNLVGVVTDFEPILDRGAESRTTVQFQLNGPYRLINMNDLNPLSKLDMSVYWTDEYLNRYLLYITEGQVLTIKIVFIKKSTFEGY